MASSRRPGTPAVPQATAASFRPPCGHLGRYLVEAIAREVMRDNPVERIAPMLTGGGLRCGVRESVDAYVLAVFHLSRLPAPGVQTSWAHPVLRASGARH
jgi:hypothetical protein